MKDLQKLTKIVQEANPELMELRKECPDCYGDSYNDEKYFIYRDCSTCGRKDANAYVCKRITLEHVLVAIRKVNDTQISVTETGCLKEKGVNTNVFWQLTKPLQDQSEETIKLLLDILEK